MWHRLPHGAIHIRPLLRWYGLTGLELREQLGCTCTGEGTHKMGRRRTPGITMHQDAPRGVYLAPLLELVHIFSTPVVHFRSSFADLYPMLGPS